MNPECLLVVLQALSNDQTPHRSGYVSGTVVIEQLARATPGKSTIICHFCDQILGFTSSILRQMVSPLLLPYSVNLAVLLYCTPPLVATAHWMALWQAEPHPPQLRKAIQF